jgi:hypothetical protein
MLVHAFFVEPIDLRARTMSHRLQGETTMTPNPTMKGEKIYEHELDLTGVTDYGVSMDDLLTECALSSRTFYRRCPFRISTA